MLLDDLRTFWSTGRYPGGKSPLQQFMTTAYFPGWKKAPGSVPVAILYDNPMLRSRAASTDLVAALAERANNRIDLMTPFPNFPSELTDALAAAVARGVRVRLFVNDRESAIRGGPFLLAGYPTLIQLIEAGAEVWAWRANKNILALVSEGGCELPLAPPLALHGKLVLVDDEISIVHSSNFNIRSTYYNTEAGVVVLDHVFNRELSDLLDDLVDFRDVELSCTNGNGYLEIPALVRRLGPDDIPEMKEELGDKQPFLDAWSVAW
jgi:phosphatidylserine/phosphatidylglycerophosphate/cardiolipin synthase-like enzyme